MANPRKSPGSLRWSPLSRPTQKFDGDAVTRVRRLDQYVIRVPPLESDESSITKVRRRRRH